MNPKFELFEMILDTYTSTNSISINEKKILFEDFDFLI